MLVRGSVELTLCVAPLDFRENMNRLHVVVKRGNGRLEIDSNAASKLNGLDPENCLRTVLSRIAEQPINRIDDLLPWNLAEDLAKKLSSRCVTNTASRRFGLRIALTNKLEEWKKSAITCQAAESEKDEAVQGIRQ